MDIRSFLESRGHAAALGATAVLFSAVAAHAALSQDAERGAAAVRVSAAGAAVASNPAPVYAKPDFSLITQAWMPEALARPEGKKAFVSTPKPRVVANVLGQRKPDPGPDRVLPAAPVPAATAEPGRVTLRWAPVAKGASVATVSEIRVLRRGPGDAALASVVTLKGDATAWEDVNVKARAAYEYRLVVATAQKTKDGRAESDHSPAARATCPAGAEIRFSAGSEGNAAILLVRKWVEGDWIERAFTVFPRNEDAGRSGAIGGVVAHEGKRVDFACGFTLLSIRKEIRRFTVPFQERQIEDGQLVARQVRKEMSRECLRIEFTDDTGTKCRLWKEGDLPADAEPLTDEDR
jgi:hypothetical protein